MIAKLIAWGATREQSLSRLRDTLRQSAIAGVATNRPWLLALLDDPRVRDGLYDTLTAESIPPPSSNDAPPALAVAALIASTLERPPSDDPWEHIGPFRMSGATDLAFHDPSDAWEVVTAVERSGKSSLVTIDSDRFALAWQRGDDGVWTISLDNTIGRFAVAAAHGDTIEVSGATGRWFARPGRKPPRSSSSARQTDNAIRAPLPGKVIRVDAAVDLEVAEGTPLVILSAMKIEIVLRAPRASRIRAVHCQPNQQVDAGDLLVEIVPEDHDIR